MHKMQHYLLGYYDAAGGRRDLPEHNSAPIRIDDNEAQGALASACEILVQVTGDQSFSLTLRPFPLGPHLESVVRQEGGTIEIDSGVTTVVIPLIASDGAFIRRLAMALKRLGEHADNDLRLVCRRAHDSLIQFTAELRRFRSLQRINIQRLDVAGKALSQLPVGHAIYEVSEVRRILDSLHQLQRPRTVHRIIDLEIAMARASLATGLALRDFRAAPFADIAATRVDGPVVESLDALFEALETHIRFHNARSKQDMTQRRLALAHTALAIIALDRCEYGFAVDAMKRATSAYKAHPVLAFEHRKLLKLLWGTHLLVTRGGRRGYYANGRRFPLTADGLNAAREHFDDIALKGPDYRELCYMTLDGVVCSL